MCCVRVCCPSSHRVRCARVGHRVGVGGGTVCVVSVRARWTRVRPRGTVRCRRLQWHSAPRGRGASRGGRGGHVGRWRHLHRGPDCGPGIRPGRGPGSARCVYAQQHTPCLLCGAAVCRRGWGTSWCEPSACPCVRCCGPLSLHPLPHMQRRAAWPASSAASVAWVSQPPSPQT